VVRVTIVSSRYQGAAFGGVVIFLNLRLVEDRRWASHLTSLWGFTLFFGFIFPLIKVRQRGCRNPLQESVAGICCRILTLISDGSPYFLCRSKSAPKSTYRQVGLKPPPLRNYGFATSVACRTGSFLWALSIVDMMSLMNIV